MMQLDHLGRLEERRCLCGEVHHQHGADREVRHDQCPGGRGLAEAVPHRGQPGVVEPRGPHDDTAAMLQAPSQVVHDRARVSEVHDHVAAGQRIAGVADVHSSRQLEVGRGVERPAHLRPHAPLGAEHPDLDHRALRSTCNRVLCCAPLPDQPSDAANASASSNGPTTASALGWASTLAATSRTSSWVTPSMAARISSTGSGREETSSDLPRLPMRDAGSSRPGTNDPRSCPLPRSSSSSVSPPEITLAISSRHIDSPSSALAGRQPAYTPQIPESACCELKLYTE